MINMNKLIGISLTILCWIIIEQIWKHKSKSLIKISQIMKSKPLRFPRHLRVNPTKWKLKREKKNMKLPLTQKEI